MSDAEWIEFEGYVTERLKNEDKIVLGTASWDRDFTFAFPGFEALVQKAKQKAAAFDLAPNGIPIGRGEVLIFVCFRRPA
jgi:hypothetical protein